MDIDRSFMFNSAAFNDTLNNRIANSADPVM
jgi:hypothetical protein